MAKPEGCTYPDCFSCPLADCSWTGAKNRITGRNKEEKNNYKKKEKGQNRR